MSQSVPDLWKLMKSIYADVQKELELVLSRYDGTRAGEPFGKTDPLWHLFDTLCTDLAACPAIKQRPSLRVVWSGGKGRLSKVPWIAFLDERETKTTQEGVYCVLLFRQDSSGVYLTFNQGVTQPKRDVPHALALAALEQRASELRVHCEHLPERGFQLGNDIDLRTGRGLGKDYESSTIAYKFYQRGQVPDDAVLEADLEAVLSAYDSYLVVKTKYKPRHRLTKEVREVKDRPWDPAAALEELVSFVSRRGFVFEPWQVAAYVAALRTKPFAILAGVTGTGKSRLPALVAEGTGGVARLVPVRPDWTDSADVLGYTDLQGRFRPGVVLDAAREAMGHPRRHWTCILDEMNLARVEQYFAEVLSRIEDRRPHPRGGWASTPLLHTSLQAGEEWSPVVLPPNLALVGTVNVDESAHGFSRKVLDRAFTLELSEVDLSAWESTGGEAPEPGWWPVSAWRPRAVTLPGFGTLTDPERARVRETVAALAEANAFLVPAGLQVGYRTRDEAALFVLHAAEVAPTFRTRAGEAVDPLDLVLGMKLLPRVGGGSDAVRRAVLGLLGWTRGGKGLTEAAARDVVEGWEAAGRPPALPGARFPRTAARLALMWERLLAEGYTSFWT